MSQQQAPEQEQQNPAPHQSAAPAGRRRGALILVAVVVALLAVAGGAWAVLGRSADDGVDSAVFGAASTPAEKVRAAVQVMHDAGTVRSQATTAEGNTTETQADFRNHVIYGETTTARFGKVAVVIRGGEGAQQVYMRYDQGIGPIKANTWYRSSDSTMTLASAMLDPKYFDTVIEASPSIVESGTVDVAGTEATRYVVTLDKNAVLDYLGTLINSSGMDVSTFRTQMMASLPDSVEYAIDDAGRIVQIVEGPNITHFDNFGKPIEVPTIDESAVVPMPTR
jgi:hypothetical protein